MNRRELFKRAIVAPLAAVVPLAAAPAPGSYEWIMRTVADGPGIEYVPLDWTSLGYTSKQTEEHLEIYRYGEVVCRIDYRPLSEAETAHALELAKKHGW